MSVTAAPLSAAWSSGWRSALARLADLCRRRPELVTAALCALVFLIGVRGPDLPAQNYRVWLFKNHGLVVFDSHWYAGHTLPGYSLLFPPLAAFVGARLVGALSCVVATALFARLVRGTATRGHDVAVLLFAVVSVVNFVVGRLPFALGVATGLWALVAVRDRRPWLALLMAGACSAASPLAGAFLLLLAVAWLPSVGWRRVAPLAGAFGGIAAAATFGEGGYMPFPAISLLSIVGFVAVGLAVGRGADPVIRRGLLLYAAASLLLFVVPNAIGGNMVRLGAIAAGPVAAYELLRLRRTWVLALVAAPLLFWQFQPIPQAVATGTDNPSARASYYAGLAGYLQAHGSDIGRVEVPLTRGRWETDYLATKVALARGWERQTDLAHNSVLYRSDLAPDDYHRWLIANGVRWVALPDVPFDRSAEGELKLLTGPPLSFLRPVWSDPHWRLWAVRGSPSLVAGPAHLHSIGVSELALDVDRADSDVTVLVRWTRFWTVVSGSACVGPSTDGWVQVHANEAGRVVLRATVGLRSLFPLGQSAHAGPTCAGG